MFELTEHEMHNLAPAQVQSFAISTQDNKGQKAHEKHRGGPGPQAIIGADPQVFTAYLYILNSFRDFSRETFLMQHSPASFIRN